MKQNPSDTPGKMQPHLDAATAAQEENGNDKSQ